MSAVKKGDRVRATCGESVVIGTVAIMHADGVEIMPDGYTRSNNFGLAGWTVEVIAPPVIVAVGTIVRDCDGDAWQRREDAWYSTSSGYGFPHLHELQNYAPFTVLWTPEATS